MRTRTQQPTNHEPRELDCNEIDAVSGGGNRYFTGDLYRRVASKKFSVALVGKGMLAAQSTHTNCDATQTGVHTMLYCNFEAAS